MKLVVKIVVALAVLLVVVVGGVALWANSATNARLAKKFTAHSVDIPVPMPLTDDEKAALAAERAGADGAEPAGEREGDEGADAPDPLAGVDLDAIALERARARGKHLVESRFACIECHNADFSGGGVMVDDGAMGTWLGPNLTAGEGSKTKGYTIADWDRIVRHGIKRDGTPAIMPSDDFVGMSDQELSDIVAYATSFPAKDNVVPAPTYGPVGLMLAATGALPLSAETIEHEATHPALPPPTGETVEFGSHLAQICTGCHRKELNGGPIQVGPPDWPPAGNLTAHESGLKGWTYEQFASVMTTGKRADGTEVKAPMTLIPPYAAKMKPVELKALWTYLQSLPPQATGQ